MAVNERITTGDIAPRKTVHGSPATRSEERKWFFSSPSPIQTPTGITTPTSIIIPSSNEETSSDGKSASPVGGVTAATSDAEQNNNATVNPLASAHEEEFSGVEGSLNYDSDFQESAEHNLPDSPFASPTKSSFSGTSFSSKAMEMASTTNNSDNNSAVSF